MAWRNETELHHYQAKFERYVALTTTQATSIRYSKALEQFFRRFSDRKSPDEFTRRDIEDYIVLRLRDGVVNRTVNYEVTVVKNFWNWLIRMDVASYNPCSTAKRLKEVEPPKRSLSEEDQHRLYDTALVAGDIYDRVLVALALTTGLRAETLFQLENSDVDFETSTLRIPAKKMKAGRNHEVPLRQDVIDLVRQLPEGRFFEGYAKSAPTLSRRFNRLLRRAGILLRGLRVGRRTFATTLLRTGTDIALVQELMGHRSVLTTSRYLTRADEATTKAAIDRLPQPKEIKNEEFDVVVDDDASSQSH